MESSSPRKDLAGRGDLALRPAGRGDAGNGKGEADEGSEEESKGGSVLVAVRPRLLHPRRGYFPGEGAEGGGRRGTARATQGVFGAEERIRHGRQGGELRCRVEEAAAPGAVSDHEAQGNGAGVHGEIGEHLRQGDLPVRRLRQRPVPVGNEVRFEDRLAEVLRVGRGGEYPDGEGPELLRDADRGSVRPVRRPSRTRLFRRAEADGASVLHQLRGPRVRQDRIGTQGAWVMAPHRSATGGRNSDKERRAIGCDDTGRV